MKKLALEDCGTEFAIENHFNIRLELSVIEARIVEG
jgi:hypothetical protein